MKPRGLGGPLVALLLLPGCALLSRGEPVSVRYFDPSPRSLRLASAPSPGCSLALGRIEKADDLREEIVFRISPYEVGYYETRRWTETPDNYLRRTLERLLFEDRRCQRVLKPAGTTLDVTLLAFDELREPESAHVAAHVVLYDDRSVLYDATVEATRRVPGGEDGFEELARAMGGALEDVVAQIVAGVELSLRGATVNGSGPPE